MPDTTPNLFTGLARSTDPDTSHLAAERVLLRMTEYRTRVLEYLQACGDAGSTDECGVSATGMRGSTYRGRRSELTDAGLVQDSGRRKETSSGSLAVIWVVTGASA